MRDYRDRVVVVTGAASGIGRACAEAFAARGARLHLADLDEVLGASVRDALVAAGARATFHPLDCRDAEAVAAFAGRVYEAEDRVDVLHLNAGIGHAAAIEETTLDHWHQVLSVNLHGVVYGIHAFVPRLLAQGGESRVVLTASGLGLVAAPRMAPYCASKFAVLGIAESMERELAQRGVRVHVLCPGVINTPIVDTSLVGDSLRASHERSRRYFKTHGATAEKVARDLLRGMRRGRHIIITPRRHVWPSWYLKRLWPAASRRMIHALASRVHGE